MQLYAAGSRFSVYLWEEENKDCPALDFLEALARGGKRERGDAATLDRRLRYFAEHGPPAGEERCRYFAGEKTFELKAPGGARLIGFYHPTQPAVVVCSHGFRKPASNRAYRPEIERAQAIRERLRSGP